MKRKKKAEPGQGVPDEGLSAEMKAFENFAKKVLSVSKEELDRREAESQKRKE